MPVGPDPFASRRAATRRVCGRCRKPKTFLYGTDTECRDCRMRTKPEAFRSGEETRCPSCGHVEKVDSDRATLYAEGEHDTYCEACDYDYTVSTQVAFTYTSPEML
ncbi:MAG: hypothetical protein ACYTFV_03765 [Planctomycetota bacterium]|jgi:hypothetical protein